MGRATDCISTCDFGDRTGANLDFLIAQARINGELIDARSLCDTIVRDPSSTQELVSRACIHSAQLSTDLGDLADANRRWGIVLKRSANSNDSFRAEAYFYRYWCGNDATAHHRLDRAIELHCEGTGWSYRAAACKATLNEDYSSAINFDLEALAIANELGDIRLKQLCLEKLAVAHAYLEELDQSGRYCADSIEIAIELGMRSVAVRASLSLADIYADLVQPELQLEACARATELVAMWSLDEFEHVVAGFTAGALVTVGRIYEAALLAEFIDSRELLEGSPYCAAAAAQSSHVWAEHGDLVQLEQSLARAERSVASFGYASFSIEVDFDRLRLAALQGKETSALLEIARAIDTNEPAATARIALWFARWGLMQSDGEIVGCAQEMLTAAGSIDDTLVRMVSNELAAIATALVTGEATDLHACALAWKEVGHVLNATRAEGLCAMTASRAGCEDSVEFVRSCIRDLNQCGARTDTNFLSAQIRRSGTQTWSGGHVLTLNLDKATGLTRRESEVARLAASGHSNSAIGEHLGLSLTTVTKYLSSAFRKLGVTSRIQLVHALDQERVIA